MSELAVPREGPDVEIHVAVTDHIGVAAVDELLHELDHVGDVAGCPRLIARADHSEGVVCVPELTLVGHRPGPPRLAGGRGLREDLVVDVGHVADHRHAQAGAGEPAGEDVEHDDRAHVPDVRRRLHGGSADVDSDLSRLQRDELAQRTRGGVEEVKGHGRKATGAR